MVDSELETLPVVRDANTPSRLDITVGETLSDGVIGIRDGSVVEVAAEDDGVTSVSFNVSMDGIGLRSTLSHRTAKGANQVYRFCLRCLFLHRAIDHVFIAGTVIDSQVG